MAGALLTWERESTPQALTEGASVRSKPGHPLAPLKGVAQAGSGKADVGVRLKGKYRGWIKIQNPWPPLQSYSAWRCSFPLHRMPGGYSLWKLSLTCTGLRDTGLRMRSWG